MEKGDKIKISIQVILVLTIITGLTLTYCQLYDIKKTNRDKFLLKISKTYGSGEIARARVTIHKFHRATELELKKQFSSRDNLEYDSQEKLDRYNQLMSDKVFSIRKNEEKAEDFTNILIFLDFLEAVSHFIDKGSLSKEDISKLLSTTLRYYYGIFKGYILDRREKYDSDYCIEFEKQVLGINT